MSYDTSIVIDTGGEYLAEICDIGNMTSNIGGMYYAALPGPYPGGGRYNGTGESRPSGGLPGLSGLPCADAIPILREGIAYMNANANEMRTMEPENGWGSYEGALSYLCKILAACEQHPRGILAVNW